MNLQEIAKVLGAIDSLPSTLITSVSTDSRLIEPGALFIALKGPHFDGHEFISLACEKGAVAVISERLIPCSVPLLIVPDALDALAKLAVFHRKVMQGPIIALTGSNGKTTVKEMLASLLPEPSLATPGNLNNHIGLPLSLLKLRAEHRYGVFELGANHPGEIARNVAIVQPSIALINNIGPAHIEGFGSIEGVARTKGEIYQSTAKIAVVNDDDVFAHFWDDLLIEKRVLRFSMIRFADIYAKDILLNENGCATFKLHLPGDVLSISLKVPGYHSVQNALAAASCAYAAGVDAKTIEQGLNRFKGVLGRMTYREGKNKALVIDDTYNANLSSVLKAIDVLAARKGRKILVLGDLGELGDYTRPHHEEIGKVAKQKGIDHLISCGSKSLFSSQAFGSNSKHYASQEGLVEDLLPYLDGETTLLVKGSRSAAMEKIVQKLVE